MAYLIEGKNCPMIFCANYQTSSNPLAKTLMSMGAIRIGSHHDPPKNIPIGAVVVQTVRNHFDVIVSFYYKDKQSCSFEDYVDTILEGDHLHLKPDGFYKRFGKWDYILTYNTLQFEFDILCMVVGLPCTKIDLRPANKRWQDLFAHDLQQKVVERYSEELKRIEL